MSNPTQKTRKQLAPRERDLATAFFAIKRTNGGNNPTMQELGAALGLTISSVANMLRRMEAKGHVSRKEGQPRSIEVMGELDPGPVVHCRARFAVWVKMIGHSELARRIGTNRLVVHSWTNSQAETPKPPSVAYANKMVELSHAQPLPDGPITFQDIYDGTTGLRGQTRSVEVPPPAPQITAGATANA